jgi:hypothetical protein
MNFLFKLFIYQINSELSNVVVVIFLDVGFLDVFFSPSNKICLDVI